MKLFPESLDDLLARPFLTSPDWERFSSLVQKRFEEIGPGESVLCAEHDPVAAFSVMFATVLKKGGVFLVNPRWKENEWDQLSELVSFHRIFGTESLAPDTSQAKHFDSASIMISSGGTSGKVRFCVHSLATLAAAVESLFRHHGERPLNSIGKLPIFHVSGLMPILRALLTEGIVQLCDWQALNAGSFPKQPGLPCFLSLVPTQLALLVKTEEGLKFLHRMDSIYVGGAGTPAGMVQLIRGEKLPVEFVYGMTETAAMVIYGTRGDTDESGTVWGQALPGVNLSLNEEQVICIRSKSLFRGYFPEDAERSEYETDDIGRWVTDDLIEILGRRDFIINTGGEKVNPEEVEASLASLLPGVAVAVGAKADAQWGEAVVALVESPLSREQVEQLISKLSATLAPYKVPKEILTGVEVPRSSLGKVNRAAVRCYLSEK